jgi:phage repressor protein C with HTH and peptisase S24 domain
MLKEWILKAISHSGISQAALARGLTDALGRTIDRAAVNKMTKGTRAIAADELLVIARITGVQQPEADNEAPRPRQIEIVGYVAAGSQEVTFSDGQGPFGTVDAPAYATESTVAVEVRGTSLGPFMDRWLIFYDRIEQQPGHDFEGRLCVVGLADGRVMVKALKRAKTPGFWHLISNNPLEAQINDQVVEWAALVRGMQAI